MTQLNSPNTNQEGVIVWDKTLSEKLKNLDHFLSLPCHTLPLYVHTSETKILLIRESVFS